jgi:putative transcriptional regulator
VALRWIARVGGAAGAIALALSVSSPVDASPSGHGNAEGLTGRVLVAAPVMRDPRFSRAVIYVVHHDAHGALGLIVNRPFKEVPVASVLDRLGLAHEGVGGSIRLHYGGPVEPGRIFVLHTADYRKEGTRVIADGIALTPPAAGILRAIGERAGPRRALLVLGYSGWGPGQLEAEIRAGGWFVEPADAALVLDEDHDTKWQRAIARRHPDEIDL